MRRTLSVGARTALGAQCIRRVSGALQQQVANFSTTIGVCRQRTQQRVQTPFIRCFASGAVHTEKVPQLGESISEGRVAKWLKAEGESVEADEIVAVIETDKVAADIRSSKAGQLVKHLAAEGATVPVGAPLFEVDTSKKGASAAKAAPKEAPKAHPAPAQPQSAPAAQPAASKAQAPSQPQAAPAPAAPAPSAGVTTTAGPKPAALNAQFSWPAGSRNVTRVPASPMRVTIARRLKESQNLNASLTATNEVDMTTLMAFRDKYKEAFEKKHGVKLGFMSAFTKAAVMALKKFPDVNASLDIEKKEIIYRDYIDIGVAVATPTGLVVPALRNCEMMSFADVELAIKHLGEKARARKISMEDLDGGTFTISNGGVFGSLFGTPIINPPQSAILGMHGIHQRAHVVGGKVEARPMMYIALTYDHRIIDGGTAVNFLKEIKFNVEDPSRILLDL